MAPRTNIFSIMSKEKQFVATGTMCTDVTLAPNLEQITNQLGLENVQSLKLYFKKNKVSASCKCNGRSFGSTGATIHQTLFALVSKINRGLVIIKQQQK